ncbi:PEP-CTERM sorting domain-containing protein [Aulosira sp. FACHB-615]|uniref:PEP-CTERM sorting domain-containing protein n=1 Tax=Aulosira sp. FACHB-615 TaxID=2692777 RepID=UPI0016893AA9|nr:PEP-CTERM sorting domain-containing protein [Aulosira sp. FACHB-615]MBD2487058.1 PEP-CTERM sorting domain-containing protein [Aulosira sp. FACHB-615]
MLKIDRLTTKIKNLAIVSGSAVFMTLGINTSAMAAILYDVTDLDSRFFAMDINDHGQVVGSYNNQAVVWSQKDGLVELGNFTGGNYSNARAINNNGQVVGISSTPYSTNVAVLWDSNGNITDISSDVNAYYGVAVDSTPYDINDHGQVIVEHNIGTSILWSQDTSVVEIAPIQLEPFAYRINNHGQIVGSAQGGAFLWSQETGLTLFNLLPGEDRYLPTGINHVGQVIFFWEKDAITRGFLWSQESGIVDISFLDDSTYIYPNAINDSGQVVGDSSNGAFFWSESTGIFDLDTLTDPSLGWDFYSAIAINNKGQILAQGDNGKSYGYVLLTPRNAEPVPEPITMGGTLLAGIGLAYLRRQRRLRSSQVTES